MGKEQCEAVVSLLKLKLRRVKKPMSMSSSTTALVPRDGPERHWHAEMQ